MKYKDYIVQMREIQQRFAECFDNNGNNSDNISIINQFFTDLKSEQNAQQIKELLHFISRFSNNHHRYCNFYSILEETFRTYKEDILQNFSNRQIFRIFCKNKLIILLLFEMEILTPAFFIFKTYLQLRYIKKGYLQYFYPEFKNYINENTLNNINKFISNDFSISDQLQLNSEEIENDIELFKQKRKKGENDEYICQLIQKDSVEDFITYVNKTNLSLKSNITGSIYETNPFLLKKDKTTLIDYAAFSGSIQILRYLFMNNVELTPSMWLYAIHGENPEIIHFLEENKIMPDSNSLKEVLIESIKCHHNEFADYIQLNLMNISENPDFNLHSICRKYNNYYFFPDELEINSDTFYDFCEFDYISIVDLILERNDVNLSDLNALKVSKKAIWLEKDFKQLYHVMIKIEQTPFQATIRKGNFEIFKLLFKKLSSFDVNERIADRALTDPLVNEKTPLAIAVQNYDIDIANYILTNTNVDVNLYSIKIYFSNPHNKEMTPLQFAILNEDAQMVKLLLSQPSVDINKKSLLKISYQKDKTLSVKTPLYHAVETQNPEIINILIEREDININEICIDGEDKTYEYLEATALSKAVLLGNAEVVDLLLSKKDIVYDSIFKLKKKSEDDLQERSAFYAACELRRKEIVSRFLSLPNIDINYVNVVKFRDNEGFYETTPFYIECDNGDLEIVRLLLSSKDIDINFKSKYKSEQKSMTWNEYIEKSALHHVIDKVNIELIRVLLEQPILNVNDIFLVQRKTSFTVNKQIEKTALHLAIEKNSLETVRLLLTRNDLQINLKYHYFKYRFKLFKTEDIQTSALHMAVKNNAIEIVKVLLTYDGIDISIKNESGLTPLDIAKNEEIIRLLKNVKG